MNGHIIGFHPQTLKLESPYKASTSTLAVKGLKTDALEKISRIVLVLFIHILKRVIYSNFKGCKDLKEVCERGTICRWKVYQGVPFLKKKRHIKRYGVGPRDRAVLHKTLLSTARI